MVLVDLLVSLMSSQTCSEELTLLLRIFLEKTPCTVCMELHRKIQRLTEKTQTKHILLYPSSWETKETKNILTDQNKVLVSKIILIQKEIGHERFLKCILKSWAVFNTRKQDSN